ncbi:tetratricopeptide repeat protein [bacterium]|nr:tetratricopeptide repeat protein [bacterium]
MNINRRWDPWLIGAAAFLIRLIYILQLKETPFFEFPIVDAEFHDAWARAILEQGPGSEEVFFRAPLYPYFLAMIYALSNGSFFMARVAQCLLGALTAALTYLLGRDLTGKRSVGLISGIGAVFYGMLVYYDGELLVETLFVPLLLGSFYAFQRVHTSQKPILFSITGMLLGLAAITRPSALILLPIFVLYPLYKGIKDKGDRWLFRYIAALFAFIIGVFLPILPVTHHNVYRGGDFVLIGTSGGINFYLGNNPEADGLHSFFPETGANWDVPYITTKAYQATGQALKPSQVSSYYYELGRDYLLSNPIQAIKLWGKKLFAFWTRLEISNNRDLYFFVTETRLMPFLRLVGFWLIGPLGLVGWWIAWRKRITPAWFNWILPLYMVGVMAFFVTSRFRLPMAPVLLIYSGITLTYLASFSRDNWKRRDGLIIIVALALAFPFVNLNLFDFQVSHLAHSHYSLGNAYLKQGDNVNARKAYRFALEADPNYPLVHLNLGVAAYREGDRMVAEQEYRLEIAINPDEAMAWNNLGVLYFEEGDYITAKDYFERAQSLQPYFQDARVNLAECYFQLGLKKAADGETNDAAELFASALNLIDDNALYHYNYALAMGRSGYLDRAIQHLQRVLQLSPNFAEAENLLLQIQNMESAHP